MGYKIFFAYQSDSDDRFNKGFIHQASLNAIEILKKEGYNIEFDYGFKKTPGTPILINEMLKKSDEADMVLVDLTFTSSKNIFLAKKIKSLGKIITFGRTIDDKFSSNPNVLLETGYAWAKKGTYRTLAIMNTAFGNPDDLSVDLKGFRWGIRYNLNDKNYINRKEVRDALTKNLYDAFKASIAAEPSYQIEKWKPIHIHEQWKKGHPFPFVLTAGLKTKILDLRDKLLNYKGPIRFTGLPGSGKTRLILEIFQKNGELEYNELNEKILYHDYGSELSGDISKQMYDLKYSNQHKIFIADNCSLAQHDNLVKLFTKSSTKLLSINTIDSLSSSDGENFYVEESIVNELVQTIIMSKYNVSQSALLIKNIDSDLNRIIPIIESGINENDLSKSTVEILKLIIGQKYIDLGGFKFLKAISLFQQIGFSDQYKNQLNLIRTIFVGCSENKIIKLIELLEVKGLIKIKGNFIVLNGFKEELIGSWKNESINNLDEIVKGVSEIRLWHNFKKPFFDLLKQKPDLLTNLEGGLLSNEDFINSRIGGEFIELLSNYFPEEAFNAVNKKIEGLL